MSEEKPSIKIRNAIDYLRSDHLKLEKKEITEEELKENNKFLMEGYPTLATKIKENTLDMEIIDNMLANLDKMHIGDQTEHQASVDVGTLLRDKLVIPDMKKRGMDVSTNTNINNLSEEEGKKKVEKMFQI